MGRAGKSKQMQLSAPSNVVANQGAGTTTSGVVDSVGGLRLEGDLDSGLATSTSSSLVALALAFGRSMVWSGVRRRR